MKPNPKKHNPDPVYIKSLIAKSRYDVKQIAKMAGISVSSLYDRLNKNHPSTIDYQTQYFIESL